MPAIKTGKKPRSTPPSSKLKPLSGATRPTAVSKALPKRWIFIPLCCHAGVRSTVRGDSP